MTKLFAHCSLSDLIFEIENETEELGAINDDMADRIFPFFRDSERAEAVLLRYPLVRGASGLRCSSDPESREAWCKMLRELCNGVYGMCDASALRLHAICEACAKRGYVRLCEDAAAEDVAAQPVVRKIFKCATL